MSGHAISTARVCDAGRPNLTTEIASASRQPAGVKFHVIKMSFCDEHLRRLADLFGVFCHGLGRFLHISKASLLAALTHRRSKAATGVVVVACASEAPTPAASPVGGHRHQAAIVGIFADVVVRAATHVGDAGSSSIVGQARPSIARGSLRLNRQARLSNRAEIIKRKRSAIIENGKK